MENNNKANYIFICDDYCEYNLIKCITHYIRKNTYNIA